MTMTTQPAEGGSLARPTSTSLADVVDTILDKGLVIDAHISAAVVGIELLTVDARVVVASVDTYLRFAERVNRLDLQNTGHPGLPEIVQDTKQAGIAKTASNTASTALDAVGEKLSDFTESLQARGQPSRRRTEE